MRGATRGITIARNQGNDFNPRAPCGARLPGRLRGRREGGISIHAPHAGRDISVTRTAIHGLLFQSTRPMRGATKVGAITNPVRDISIHAPHAGRDVPAPCIFSQHSGFQSTRPIRGATHLRYVLLATASISIHAPHTGRDSTILMISSSTAAFQSTRPIRGATAEKALEAMENEYFNPRAPYGARHIGHHSSNDLAQHFNPRAPYGARLQRQIPRPKRFSISIHAPHTGRDVQCTTPGPPGQEFQSTRPIRGATAGRRLTCIRHKYFNPRAPYGARRSRPASVLDPPTFQSTRPIRGATYTEHIANKQLAHFNPRAPYGARRAAAAAGGGQPYFNPRAPYGARPSSTTKVPEDCAFQSTRPIRGATNGLLQGLRAVGISIHAPHTGRDLSLLSRFLRCRIFQSTRPIRGATVFCAMVLYSARYFNPRAPYGARPQAVSSETVVHLISIHAPHTGRDSSIRAGDSGPGYFNPRAPYGARHDIFQPIIIPLGISIHAPHTGRDAEILDIYRSET